MITAPSFGSNPVDTHKCLYRLILDILVYTGVTSLPPCQAPTWTTVLASSAVVLDNDPATCLTSSAANLISLNVRHLTQVVNITIATTNECRNFIVYAKKYDNSGLYSTCDLNSSSQSCEFSCFCNDKCSLIYIMYSSVGFNSTAFDVCDINIFL